jgi:hypothetical protein
VLRSLTKHEFKANCEPALLALCGTVEPDPFGEPFAPRIESRLIVDDYWYFPSNGLLDAIRFECRSKKEESIFLTRLGHSSYLGDVQDWQDAYYLEISLSSLEEYEGVSLPLENIVYSRLGDWGIIGSHEQHGVVGGSQEFISEIRRHVKDVDEQVYGFLAQWHRNWEITDRPPKWLYAQLKHVYGKEKAEQLLLETHLEDLIP